MRASNEVTAIDMSSNKEHPRPDALRPHGHLFRKRKACSQALRIEKDVLQLRKMADFLLRLSLPLIRRPS